MTNAVDNSPGTRYETLTAITLPDLIKLVNARIALGWRTLLLPIIEPSPRCEWQAVIMFHRVPGDAGELEIVAPRVVAEFRKAMADLREALELGRLGDANLAADQLGARGANLIDLVALRR